MGSIDPFSLSIHCYSLKNNVDDPLIHLDGYFGGSVHVSGTQVLAFSELT